MSIGKFEPQFCHSKLQVGSLRNVARPISQFRVRGNVLRAGNRGE